MTLDLQAGGYEAADQKATDAPVPDRSSNREPPPARVLILGASYGSLLAARLIMAGHIAHLICRTATAALMNSAGSIVRLPVKGREGLVEVNSRAFGDRLTASTPANVDPSAFDLAVLAMQEPQYAMPGVRELLERIARARVPTMSIMNMPPLPYLRRIPGIDETALRRCYGDATVWDNFEPGLMTLCSPDPQAFRPADEPVNVLQVRLATNFKSAAFESPAHTALLRRLESDIERSRVLVGDETIELPVKLKIHDSIFVPLAKWAMLLAGNYRCVGPESMRPIRDAVHGDIAASRSVYDWVVELCVGLGADRRDLVPFDKYAEAARSLGSPSSAARALAGGATAIERVDRLVQAIGRSRGMSHPMVDQTVALVESWLERNRLKAKAA